MTAPTRPPTSPPQARETRAPRKGRGLRALGVVAAVVAVIVVAGFMIRVPYVIFSPGSAEPVAPSLVIRGADTFAHTGEVLFLTVRVSSQRPTVWRYLQADLIDSDTRIVGEDDYLQGLNRSQSNRLNAQLMDESQLAATSVALSRLGYDATITGSGAIVTSVEPGSPADRHLQEGDVITNIDAEAVKVAEGVGDLVRARPPGGSVTFIVRRDGKTLPISVATVPAPTGENAGKAYVGISVATDGARLDSPVDVRIRSGAVSGPSAGLAFTLAIIDELSEGNLTGGKKIAVTGTMDVEGNVGEVGGVEQKTVSARRAGAQLMLMPTAEVARAKPLAGKMTVVGVDTIDDAVAMLALNGGDALTLRPAA